MRLLSLGMPQPRGGRARVLGLCVGPGGSEPRVHPMCPHPRVPTARAAMDDIFTQCREGNAVAVRLWLDNTENDLNQG